MDPVWIIGSIVTAWATLRIIGGERERRIRDVAADLNSALSNDSPPPAAPADRVGLAAAQVVRPKAVR